MISTVSETRPAPTSITASPRTAPWSCSAKSWGERRENKIVDEFEDISDEQIEAWLDERAEARLKMRHPAGPERSGAAASGRRDDSAGQASL
jgi:hypothetical protein